jgi:hypothetical protein
VNGHRAPATGLDPRASRAPAWSERAAASGENRRCLTGLEIAECFSGRANWLLEPRGSSPNPQIRNDP